MAIAGLYYNAATWPKMTYFPSSIVNMQWRTPGFDSTGGLTRPRSCPHSIGLKMAWPAR